MADFFFFFAGTSQNLEQVEHSSTCTENMLASILTHTHRGKRKGRRGPLFQHRRFLLKQAWVVITLQSFFSTTSFKLYHGY